VRVCRLIGTLWLKRLHHNPFRQGRHYVGSSTYSQWRSIIVNEHLVGPAQSVVIDRQQLVGQSTTVNGRPAVLVWPVRMRTTLG
jgi:hypothetical protein